MTEVGEVLIELASSSGKAYDIFVNIFTLLIALYLILKPIISDLFEEDEYSNFAGILAVAFIFKKKKRVEFAVFSPNKVMAGEDFILDVWAYLPKQYKVIDKFSKEFGRENLLARKPNINIKNGEILTVTIKINNLHISDPVDTMVWEGLPINTSYIVSVPQCTEASYNISKKNSHKYHGKVIISSQGISLAKINFTIGVGNNIEKSYKNTSDTIFYPKTAFASYATKNRIEVLSRIQAMKKIAPDLEIFIDIMSLRAGDNWKKKLEKHVPSKDVFYLFWSIHASQSLWVEREWKLALKKRGLKYISPVPLDSMEFAAPPKELEALHFSDMYLAYIEYEKLKKSTAK